MGIPPVLLHHAHCALADFGRELIGLVHGSIFSRVEASSKPGVIQVAMCNGGGAGVGLVTPDVQVG